MRKYRNTSSSKIYKKIQSRKSIWFISNIAKDIQRSRLWLQKYQNANPSKRNKNILSRKSGFYRKNQVQRNQKQRFNIAFIYTKSKGLYFPKLFYFIQNSVKNMGGRNIQIWPSLRKVGGKVVLMDLQIYVLDRNFVSNIRSGFPFFKAVYLPKIPVKEQLDYKYITRHPAVISRFVQHL